MNGFLWASLVGRVTTWKGGIEIRAYCGGRYFKEAFREF